MNIVPKKSLFSLCLLLLFVVTLSHAQDKRLKTIEKDFSGIKKLRLDHRYGSLDVLPSTDNKVYVAVTLSVKAKRDEDFQKVFRQFELDARQMDDMLRLSTIFNSKNWSTNFGETTIRFEDGTKVKNLKDLEINFTLYVPAVAEIYLENKYDEINISPEIKPESVRVKLYSGRFKAGDLNKVWLEMKYSKARMGNYTIGQFELYESSVDAGDGDQLDVKSKYSTLSFGGQKGRVNIEAYEDKYRIREIGAKTMIKSKYTNFDFGPMKEGMFDMYESSLRAETADDLLVKSKYSKYNMSKAGALNFESSYEDEVNISEVTSLVANSKYSQFYFDRLASKVQLDAYEDRLQIGTLVGPFEGITIDGKYIRASIGITEKLAFRVDAKLKYGQFDYDEDNLKTAYYKEKNDELEIRGRSQNATDESPMILIRGYECSISM
ncbi:MAG: hypothetical protein MRY78_09870 [Saprospiraceae bacterium]|nr:hypothetical protein [Saprospiraceae bacterium]